MRPRIKSDGTTCYEYIFLYVDNAVAVSENAEDILQNEIGRHFYLKEESIGHLTLYIGGHVQRFNWTMVYGHGHSVCPKMYKLLLKVWQNILPRMRINT